MHQQPWYLQFLVPIMGRKVDDRYKYIKLKAQPINKYYRKRMNSLKRGQGIEITDRSQMSSFDTSSKFQARFLEKFFKHNLNDYFQQLFDNLDEDIIEQRSESRLSTKSSNQVNKLQKQLVSSLFKTKTKFTIGWFQQSMQKFYRERSQSVQQNQLPFAFKLKRIYQSQGQSLIRQGQLIYMSIKIKVQVKKIIEFPQKIMKIFERYEQLKKDNITQLEQQLINYKHEYFNIFIIYFGDVNFEIFNKKKYFINTIKLMGTQHKLRIHVFFISRFALLQTFRTINKISNVQYINDLVIKFYQEKRNKRRKKKVRVSRAPINKQKALIAPNNEKLYMFLGFFGLVSFAFALKKILE